MDEGGRRRAPAHRPPEQGRKPRAAQSLLHGRANAAPSALPARLRRAPRTHLRRRAPAGVATRNPEHSGASTSPSDCHSRFSRKAARRIPADPRRAKSLYKRGKTLKKAESVARHRFAVTRMLILGYWKLCRGTDQCLSCLQTPHQAATQGVARHRLLPTAPPPPHQLTTAVWRATPRSVTTSGPQPPPPAPGFRPPHPPPGHPGSARSCCARPSRGSPARHRCGSGFPGESGLSQGPCAGPRPSPHDPPSGRIGNVTSPLAGVVAP